MFPLRSRGSLLTQRSASGRRTLHRHSYRRPRRKPKQHALPCPERKGGAPTPPPPWQGSPRPERLTFLPPSRVQPSPLAEPQERLEDPLGGGHPRLHTQRKPPAKIPITPCPSPRSRVTSCLLSPSPPTSLLRSIDGFKKEIQVRAAQHLYPEAPVPNKRRGRLLFWIRACRQNALYCACRAPFGSFYSYLFAFFFTFSFISFVFFSSLQCVGL